MLVCTTNGKKDGFRVLQTTASARAIAPISSVSLSGSHKRLCTFRTKILRELFFGAVQLIAPLVILSATFKHHQILRRNSNAAGDRTGITLVGARMEAIRVQHIKPHENRV